MALQMVKGGQALDIPTPDETAAAVDGRMRELWAEQSAIEAARQREQLRTMKDIRRSTLLLTPAGTRVTVTDGICPESGYKWLLRYLGVWLASAGTGQAFITSDTSTTLGALTQSKVIAVFTNSSAYQTVNFPQGACVLDDGEGLYLNFTQNINGYMVAGWETAAEMIGKLA